MNTSIFLRARVLLLALSGLVATGTAAAAGDLDPDFGAGTGYVVVPFGTGDNPHDQFQAVIVDSHGRTLAAGFRTDDSASGSDRDFAVVRLLPDGSPDLAFGPDGKRRVGFNLGGFEDRAESIHETADHRYVVCGLALTGASMAGPVGALAVARLLENGLPDTSFDLDGRRSLHVPHPVDGDRNVGGFCAPAADGGVVAAVGVYNAAFSQLLVGVVKLLPDGSLDATFNGTGYQVFDPSVGGIGVAMTKAIAVQPDGRIVVAGATPGSGGLANLDMFAARLLPDGALDPSFGDGGVRTIAFDQGGGDDDIAAALTTTADGGLLLAGRASTASSGNDIALVRLQADGDLATGFGTNGRVLIAYDGATNVDDEASAVTVDSQGRFLVAGASMAVQDNGDMAIVRITPTGALDPSFASGGWQMFGLDAAPPSYVDEFATAIALDARERLVVAGAAHISMAADRDGLVLRLGIDAIFADGFEPQP